jgi:hypothetical protein
MVTVDAFVDYYELLQVSPNADEDTIQRVFRHLAKKHHPDASDRPDPEPFNRLLEAYRTLTDVALRAAYDVKYQRHWNETWRVGAEASNPNGATDDTAIRTRLLSLFYVQRRRHMRNPGMGEHEVARLMDLPPEHVAFHVWYFREKGWIERLDTGYLAITADGVDQVEQHHVRPEPERLIEARPADGNGCGESSSDAAASKGSAS